MAEEEKQKATPNAQLPSIKLKKGMKGNFGWEIYISGENTEKVYNEVKRLHEKMEKDYINKKQDGGDLGD